MFDQTSGNHGQAELTHTFYYCSGLPKEGFTFSRILKQIQSYQDPAPFVFLLGYVLPWDFWPRGANWLLHLWPEAGEKGRAVGKRHKPTNYLSSESSLSNKLSWEAHLATSYGSYWPINILLIILRCKEFWELSIFMCATPSNNKIRVLLVTENWRIDIDRNVLVSATQGVLMPYHLLFAPQQIAHHTYVELSTLVWTAFCLIIEFSLDM